VLVFGTRWSAEAAHRCQGSGAAIQGEMRPPHGTKLVRRGGQGIVPRVVRPHHGAACRRTAPPASGQWLSSIVLMGIPSLPTAGGTAPDPATDDVFGDYLENVTDASGQLGCVVVRENEGSAGGPG
jgi:hypothetical protein